jgi:superoxide reductase
MTERMEVYKCEICGNIIEVLHSGKGELVCCGEPMKRMEEQTADWKNEKHVPVIEKDGETIKVKVGSTPHPMTEEHHIEWIEISSDAGRVYRKYLEPGSEPGTHFLVCEECSGGLKAREYCNIHNLWSSDKE